MYIDRLTTVCVELYLCYELDLRAHRYLRRTTFFMHMPNIEMIFDGCWTYNCNDQSNCFTISTLTVLRVEYSGYQG